MRDPLLLQMIPNGGQILNFRSNEERRGKVNWKGTFLISCRSEPRIKLLEEEEKNYAEIFEYKIVLINLSCAKKRRFLKKRKESCLQNVVSPVVWK